MITYTTPTGIELLMPQIPKEGEVLEFTQNFLYYKEGCIQHGINLMHPPTNGTILGTCWREGGILKSDIELSGYGIDESWLRSEGITIPEGQKRVLIKIN